MDRKEEDFRFLKKQTIYVLSNLVRRDHSRDLQDVNAIFTDIFRVSETTLEERQLIKRVCELVGIRAARLSAAGIAAVVTKMNRLDGCTVAIDGSVFEHYPHFANRMRDALHELVGLSSDNVEFALGKRQIKKERLVSVNQNC